MSDQGKKLKEDLEEIAALEKEHNILGVSICTKKDVNVSTEDAIPYVKELIKNSSEVMKRLKEGKIKRV